ncbi:hypothetical protein [Streptomyces melanogenes]|uniref:hypothetical protein n=1 Tax=Streptomyces melanogenes TaxID=67326 RepID=UPI00379B6CCC
MVVLAGMVALGVAVPQAQAGQTVRAADVTAGANAETRALAAAHPREARAAAVVCGEGYVLDNAQRLPTQDLRLATLFTYRIPTDGDLNNEPTCAILDNNTGTRKWMKLKMCSNWIADGCAEDTGYFAEYAGPVYRARGGCGKVYAIMKNSSSSTTALVDAIRASTVCD